MKLKTKVLSSVIAGVMTVMSFCGVMPKILPDTGSEMTVSAAASDFTVEQGAQWGRDRVNESWEVDVDNYAGCQCVDLLQAYGSYLGVYVPSLMAYQYETWALPSGWTRTYGSPKIGDMFVMDLALANNGAGHVGLVTGVNGSSVTTAETNYWYEKYGNRACRSVTRDVSKYTCFIHPNFKSATVTPAKPNPVTVTEGYASMTTIFSWNACSNATSYDLRIYTSSSLSAESRIDNYGSLIKVKDTRYSIVLPQGVYWVTIASVNDASGTYQFAEKATKFTVKAPDYYIPSAVKKFNDHIYAFYDYATYYEQAEKLSKQFGGHLVTISNKKENEIAANIIGNNKKSWMGLIRNKSGEFEWTDGTTLSYTNWNDGEPNNDGGAENHGVIYSSGKWNDSYTGMYTTGYFYGFCGFIVEYEPNDIKPVAATVYNGHQYEYYDIPVGYDLAKEICEKSGGYLVTISDKKENDIVKKLIEKNKKSWLGLIKNKKGEFEWTDGTILSYTNWSEGEPNNDGGVENYGVIYANGEWNDSYTGKFPTGDFYAYCGFVLEKVDPVGDVNSDNKFNSMDAVQLKKFLLGMTTLKAPQNADMNGDGNINVFDLIVMKRLLISK